MCNMCVRADGSLPEPPAPAPAPAPAPVSVSEGAGEGLLERMKRKHNITTEPGDEARLRDVAYQPDLLAVSTQWTRQACAALRTAHCRLQDTKAYAIVTRTTQPLHALLGLALLLGAAAGPPLSSLPALPGAGSERLWRALYVIAVATHFGAQFWMTFVSGLVLYFNLPRHEFGRVQTVLFPAYFAFNAAASLLALLAYTRAHSFTQFAHISWIQLALLACVFVIEALVRARLVRPMLRAKHVKTQMEAAAGGGQEVGKLVLGELAHCPRYMSVLRAFRAYHSSVAAGTLICFGCSLYSTLILADSLCR